MTLSGKLMGGDRIDALKLTFYVSPVVLLALLPVGMHAEWDSMTEKYAIASVRCVPYTGPHTTPFAW
jgi:hypothetical protein